jgi:hypothetical protein
VDWWVAQATTMTTASFAGTILSGAAITMTGLAGSLTPFTGNTLAKAAVTLTDVTVTSCAGNGNGHGNDNDHDNDHDKDHKKCNQGVGNGPEDCDPGKSHMRNPFGSNDEDGGTPGNPGRKGGRK